MFKDLTYYTILSFKERPHISLPSIIRSDSYYLQTHTKDGRWTGRARKMKRTINEKREREGTK